MTERMYSGLTVAELIAHLRGLANGPYLGDTKSFDARWEFGLAADALESLASVEVGWAREEEAATP